jgi:phosphohistidine phosphatase
MTLHTLVLLRHAKAESPEGYGMDIERPLQSRGRADAEAAGRWLLDSGFRPDQVLCSTAQRTRETWQSMESRMGQMPILYESSLYLADAVEALGLVQTTEVDIGTLLVIGHNPTMSVLSGLLDENGSASDGLHTAGLAVHRFEGTWAALDAHGAPLLQEHTARAGR